MGELTWSSSDYYTLRHFDQCMIWGIVLLRWNCVTLWHLDGLRSTAPMTPSFLWPLAHLMSTTIFIVGDYYSQWQLNKLWHRPWEIHLKLSNGRTEIGTQVFPFVQQPSHYSIKIPLYGELWLVTDIIEIYTHLSWQASCFAYIIFGRIRKWQIQWYFFFSYEETKVRGFSHSPKSQSFPMVEQSWKARWFPLYNHVVLPHLSGLLPVTPILTSAVPPWTLISYFFRFPFLRRQA